MKFKNIFFKLFQSIFKLTLYLNFHYFYAFILFHITKHNFIGSKKGMLIFDRINSDMKIIKEFEEYDKLFFSSKSQYRLAKLFLDPKIMSQKNYFELNSIRYQNQKLNYEKNISKVLIHLKKFISLDIIFVANCNYYEHQAWANALKKQGTQVIVYSKESVLAEGRSSSFNNHFSNLSNNIKNIDKILVYGDSGYKQYLNTGLVDNKDIIQVGSLKTDLLFKDFTSSSSKPASRNKVTLFAFPCGDFPKNFDVNSNYSKVWQGGYWAPELWKDTLDAFITISQSLNNFEFLIKTKSPDSTEMIIREYPALKNTKIEISDNKKLWEIYKESKLVIGFNSTVILEMLTTNIPIFIPKWNEAIDPQLESMMILNNISNAYNSLESKNQMIDLITKYLTTNTKNNFINNSKEARQKILFRHLYKVDGNVKKRILNSIS